MLTLVDACAIIFDLSCQLFKIIQNYYQLINNALKLCIFKPILISKRRKKDKPSK